ncbi:MAG: hypothetical protein ABWZ80_09975 [Beijerinckiaceae bacterium]
MSYFSPCVVRIFVVAAFGLWFAAPILAQQNCFDSSKPYSCYPGGDINPATSIDYASRAQAYAEFAWQDFIALNFPAAIENGRPQPRPSTSNGLGYNDGQYTTVWQTWSQATDLFRPGATPPPQFGGGHLLPNACLSLKGGPGKLLRKTRQGPLTDSIVLSEYIQANRMGPVIDQNGQYVRFGLNFNQAMHDYIVNNNLFSAQGQTEFDKNNPNRDKPTVQFPTGSYNGGASTNVGSIFVKSSWKILGAGDDPGAFHRIKAYVYEQAGGAFNDEPTVAEKCVLADVGLVGFHIVHLTDSAPAWSWATFEHKSNAPWLADFIWAPIRFQTFSFFNVQRCPPRAGCLAAHGASCLRNPGILRRKARLQPLWCASRHQVSMQFRQIRRRAIL